MTRAKKLSGWHKWAVGKLGGKVIDTSAPGWVAIWGKGAKASDDDPEVWASYDDEDYEAIYHRSAIVHACVTEIMTTAVEPPLQVGRADGDKFIPLPDHPVQTLLDKPNSLYTCREFIQYLVARLCLTGKIFVWKFRTQGQEVHEYWPMPSSWVTPVTKKGTQPIAGYKVKQGQGEPKSVRPEDMVYIWRPDPAKTYEGIGMCEAAQRAYQIDQEEESYLKEMISNLHVPGLVLRGEDAVVGEDREELREELYNRCGRGMRGKPLILSGPNVGADILNPLADLDMPGLTNLNESRICMAFGVPPILVGARVGLERSTYANYEEARRSFYQETMVPLWLSLADGLTKGMCEQEDFADIEIRFDLGAVYWLQEDEDKRSERARENLKAGLWTLNRALQETGEEPLKQGGDVLYIPVNVQVVSLEELANPEPAPEPPSEEEHAAGTVAEEEESDNADNADTDDEGESEPT